MTTVDGDDVTVLHVDDDPDLASMTADFLQHENDDFDVLTATSADAGLERLREGDVDCVVSDYQMPGMNGLEFLDAVREEHPRMPFVLFTGRGSEAVAAEAIERGVTSYLQKEGGTAQYTVLANRIRTHVEQYRTEENARELREEYELVAEVATDVFWTVDLQTGELTLSDGIERFGYDPEAIDPDHEWWVEHIHPEDRERMLREHEKVLTPDPEGFEELSGDRGRFENEFRWRRADGTHAEVLATGVTVFDGGDAVKQIGTMTDVTQRRDRQEELGLFRELIDVSNALIYVNDAETGELRYANETAANVLGYDREELESLRVWDIEANLPDREAWEDHVENLRAEGRMRFEGEQVRADGTTVPVDVALAYVSLSDDYVVAVARDVSERREREQELEATKRRLEAVIEASPDAIMVFDRDARVRLWNPAAEAIFGWSAEEVVGESPPHIPESDWDDFQEHFQQVLDGARWNGLERERATKSGESIHVCISVAPIREFDDEITGGMVVIKDVSDRVAFERELERQNERLEQFASVLSHDLRNPLQVAQGQAALAAEASPSVEPELDRVSAALDRMDELISDAYTLAGTASRVEETDPTSVAALARECWRTVSTPEADLEVEADHEVEADPSLLKRCFENLFSNAVTHAGPDVTVQVGPLADDGGFYVADDGPGIPEADREAVLEPGFTTSDDGNGLGLSIVEQVVAAHGWSLDVTANEAGGARFEIRTGTAGQASDD